MRYFSVNRIREAVGHLNQYDSGWVIGPFVYACNDIGIGPGSRLRPPTGVGTDGFLDNFFHPRLLGLKPKANRESLRPVFREMGNLAGAGDNTDHVMHQDTRIWGNVYSQTFSSMVVNRGLVKRNDKDYSLSAAFQPAFEAALPSTFRFEELLVWLFAFSGFPDDVATWDALWMAFRGQYLNGRDVPAPYRGRFSIRPGSPPWPAAEVVPARPTNRDLVLGLLPSAFSDPITGEQWQQIAAMIGGTLEAGYEGLAVTDAERMAGSIASSLAATKRVFLLGDPGTGKTRLAEGVLTAFREVLGAERVLGIQITVTGRTTETTLMGFSGLDGRWVDGDLTAKVNGMHLFTPVIADEDEGVALARRRQVNVIVLNEANRTDVEALLGKLQQSLDSGSQDPADDSHVVQLGGAGPHRISPWTYILMTGNSPRDDAGRSEQSRPLQRRVGLLWIPNTLVPCLANDTPEMFQERVARVWQQHSYRSLLAGTPAADEFHGALMDLAARPVTEAVRSVLQHLVAHGGAASNAVLEKLLVLAANQMHLLAQAGPLPVAQLPHCVDRALVSGLSATAAGASGVVAGESLRATLNNPADGLAAQVPEFVAWASATLSNPTTLNTIEPLF